MKSVALFLPATALSLAALAQAACNADNVLRALQRGGQPATSLCNSLIHYGIPTVTVVPPPGQTPPPAVVTSTSTLTQSVYPDGRVLEELNFPTFVSSYPASRVSSGCSCLLGPHPTTTLTSSGSTIVSPITSYLPPCKRPSLHIFLPPQLTLLPLSLTHAHRPKPP